MIAVLRIRGDTNIDEDIRETLFRMRLRRKLACVLVDEKDKVKMGMVYSLKSCVSYDKISDELAKKIIEKRGETLNGKPIDKNHVEKVFEEFKTGNMKTAKPFFRLHPPIGGFKKSTKESYPQGVLGNNKNLAKLIEKML